jgi:small neutral amino acid transporter SnatA (MarC family)
MARRFGEVSLMEEFLRAIVVTFIPIFVATDAVGILPIFVGMTRKRKNAERRRIVALSMITALRAHGDFHRHG